MGDEYVERLKVLVDKTDKALSDAMKLASWPAECWSVDEDEDLAALYTTNAEIYAEREALGLKGRAR